MLRPLYQGKHVSGHLCEGIVKHSSISYSCLAIITGRPRFTIINKCFVTETTIAEYPLVANLDMCRKLNTIQFMINSSS